MKQVSAFVSLALACAFASCTLGQALSAVDAVGELASKVCAPGEPWASCLTKCKACEAASTVSASSSSTTSTGSQ